MLNETAVVQKIVQIQYVWLKMASRVSEKGPLARHRDHIPLAGRAVMRFWRETKQSQGSVGHISACWLQNKSKTAEGRISC